jgi:hypothetical protein
MSHTSELMHVADIVFEARALVSLVVSLSAVVSIVLRSYAAHHRVITACERYR